MIAYLEKVTRTLEGDIINLVTTARTKQKDSSLYYKFLDTAHNLFIEMHRILDELCTTVKKLVQRKTSGAKFATTVKKKLKTFKKSYEKIDSWLASLSKDAAELELLDVQKHIETLRGEMSKARATATVTKKADQLLWARIIHGKVHA